MHSKELHGRAMALREELNRLVIAHTDGIKNPADRSLIRTEALTGALVDAWIVSNTECRCECTLERIVRAFHSIPVGALVEFVATSRFAKLVVGRVKGQPR